MYLDFYKLHLKPFQISTDPQFLWLGEKHKEALAILKYGILDNKGFLLLTGDVGTGKTTLLNALIDSLGDDIHIALINDPGLAKMDFFKFVADSFQLERNFKSKGDFLFSLRDYLLEIHQQNKQTLLIIDECQHLSQKLLEEVRLLSNIEKHDRKLINIFFVGQSEFNEIILRPRNRAVRQRITINYNINALTEAETEKYIQFRLAVAGSKERIFTQRANKEVHKFSNGYPRLINIICDQALLTGYVKEKKKIDHKIVAECAAELKIPYKTTTKKSKATPESGDNNPHERPPVEMVLTPVSEPQGRQYSKPLVFAFVVVIIIWSALVVTFFLSQQQSQPIDLANRTVNSLQSQPDHESQRIMVNQPHIDQNDSPEINTDAVETDNLDTSLSAYKVEEPDSQIREIPIKTAENLNPSMTPELNTNPQEQLTTSIADETDKIEPQISLSDIQTAFGTYPEVHFEFNSNNLEREAYDMLGLIARYCQQNPEAALILRGYTDRSGNRAYNLKLSEFRADMVKTYLVGKGVNADFIKTVGVGPDTDGPAGTVISHDGKRRKVVIEILTPVE